MKANHSTGVLILDDEDKLVGIFTTKDIVLRVISTQLDPSTTSVVRVMVCIRSCYPYLLVLHLDSSSRFC